MADMFAVRNLDEKTIEAIQEYAHERRLNTAEAVRDLVFFGLQHIKHAKKEKKYNSIFDVYGSMKFRGGKDLSQRIDEVAYEG